jgi:bacteriocin-like protein
MQELNANELQQVSGGTLCALGLGVNALGSGIHALSGLLGSCPLVTPIAQGVACATQAVGSVLNGVANLPGLVVGELGKLVGGASCGCAPHPTTPTNPTNPTNPSTPL